MTKNRLETFSDSVMAIVITLLAFNLEVPGKDILSNEEAIKRLSGLSSEFLIFVLSFLTISIMWINHHYITNKIDTVNHKTVWTNSILLMIISLIPFATSFLANNPMNQIALFTYSFVMLLASFAFTLFKSFSVTKGKKTHGKEMFRHIGIYAYTLAIVVSIFLPLFTYIVLLIPPLSYLLPGKE